jgi:hypothetical protein
VIVTENLGRRVYEGEQSGRIGFLGSSQNVPFVMRVYRSVPPVAPKTGEREIPGGQIRDNTLRMGVGNLPGMSEPSHSQGEESNASHQEKNEQNDED